MTGEWLRVLRFLAVGGLNTGFGYTIYAGFVLLGAPLWLAVAGSTGLAFLFNFATYGSLVFGSTAVRSLPRFLVFYFVLGELNFCLLRVLSWLGLGPLLAQAVLMPLLALCGYPGLSGFVFDTRPARSAA